MTFAIIYAACFSVRRTFYFCRIHSSIPFSSKISRIRLCISNTYLLFYTDIYFIRTLCRFFRFSTMSTYYSSRHLLFLMNWPAVYVAKVQNPFNNYCAWLVCTLSLSSVAGIHPFIPEHNQNKSCEFHWHYREGQFRSPYPLHIHRRTYADAWPGQIR